MKENHCASPKMVLMWHFRFLGDLSVEQDNATTTLAPRKYTALLALLVLHPARRWTRDELAAQFWPDSDDKASRAALRTALSSLRKTFGPDLLETSTADTVCIRESLCTTDVAQFEQLLQKASRAALPDQEARLLDEADALSTGPLLPGIYFDWAVAARERLERLCERAQNRRVVLSQIAARESEQEAGNALLLRKAGGPSLLSLPLYNGGFVGREAEVEQITQLLCGENCGDHARLVTLTGPGGIGKTRVAVETAKNLANRFSGAVCFVPLAALTGGEEIGVALAESLLMEGTQGTEPLQQALFRLDDLGPSLLILDNMEQLVDEGATPVVRTLLARLPQTIILATSRRLLGVEGEQEFPISPLDVERCQQLFRQHARAARPGYEEGDTPTLRTLCEKLEGIPLAVELCAPWVRLLTEEEMLARLNSRFSLLTSRRRDVPTRHRSLHAALDWGCPTDPELLQFFASLSVFRGGFTLAAAEAICGSNALDHLAALCEQSLVSAYAGNPAVPVQSTMRYRMLETIREFASEKLTREVETATRRRSIAYFTWLACDLAPHLASADSARYFAALEAESPNFRAAIEWGLADTPESLRLVWDLVNELRWFWGIRGHQLPFDEWRRKACARRSELEEPLRTHLDLQYATYDAPEAERESLLLETLRRFEAMGDGDGAILTQERLAFYYQHSGRHAEMEATFRQVAQKRRKNGDLRGCGYTLANLGGAFFTFGRIVEARIVWHECRTISVSLENWGSVAVLDRAAAVAYLDEGRAEEALPLLLSAAATFRHKAETWQLMDSLFYLGLALKERGNPNEAQTAWLEALPLARRCGDTGRVQLLESLLSQVEP